MRSNRSISCLHILAPAKHAKCFGLRRFQGFHPPLGYFTVLCMATASALTTVVHPGVSKRACSWLHSFALVNGLALGFTSPRELIFTFYTSVHTEKNTSEASFGNCLLTCSLMLPCYAARFLPRLFTSLFFGGGNRNSIAASRKPQA